MTVLSRRELLETAGGIGVAITATSALAAEGHDHMEHNHMDHDHAAMMTPPPHQALLDTASSCIKTGLACINHCFETFATGDTAMVSCARSVDQMLSVCGTLAKLASVNSSHLPEMAKLALVICQECEKECRKHADHHAVCKACADACSACADECKKI
jgi:Cys-rich four helix bundle protein (predicted Tat secretion target)